MPILDLENASQVARYQQFVREHPNGQVTQDPLWGDLKANWGHVYVYHETAGQIDAALSLLTVEAVPGKLLAYSTRGPVVDDYADVALVQTLVKEAVAVLPDNTFLVRLDPEVAYSDELNAAYQAAGFTTRNKQIGHMHGNIQPRKNVVLYYDGIENDEQLMQHFKRDYRNQIRRAAKEGVTVDWATDEQAVRDFFATYVMMSEAQGITHRPLAYFLTMREAFAETGLFRVYRAYYQGQVIASGIGFAYGDEIWYMYAGSNRDFAKVYAPYAVQWEMIKWGLVAGKREYDFGGVGDFVATDGLYKFKHGFAYSDEPAEYIGELDWVLDDAGYAAYLTQFEG